MTHPERLVSALRVPVDARWLPAAYAVGAGLLLAGPWAGGAFALSANALLLIGPALALVGCLRAVRTPPAALATPWLAFAAAAAAGILAQASALGGSIPAGESQLLFQLAAAILFGVGIAWQLHRRDHDRVEEIALDALLLVGVALLVTLRWLPGARAAAELEPLRLLAVVGTPIAAGCAFLFAGVLLAVRVTRVGAGTAIGLGVAATGLLLAALPLATGAAPCCAPGHPLALAAALAWAGLAFAGFSATAPQPLDPRAQPIDTGGRRLRLVVAPAGILVSAAVVIDSAWRQPLSEGTAILLGAVSLFVTLRVGRLLYATERLSAERQELAQTRMLVDLGQALAGTTDVQTTLQVVTGWAHRMLRADAAAIELIDDSGTQLEFRAIEGLPLETLAVRVPIAGTFSGWVVRHGRARTSTQGPVEGDVATEIHACMSGCVVAAAPLRYQGHTLGVLTCISRHAFDERDLELLGALADQAAVAIESAHLFAQVHVLSMTDPLTGLPNRRQLDRDLAREFAAARRGRRLVAIMFDLNGFKHYNDQLGHLAGDHALRMFGNAIALEMRAMNMAARYGGDEFVALLADADREGANTFIERVRTRFPGPDATAEQRALSVAAGIAEYAPDMLVPEDLLAAADRALYAVKLARRAALA